LLRTQRLVSDARTNVRLYSTIKDRKSPLKGSRPSVPHGTNFLQILSCIMGNRQWQTDNKQATCSSANQPKSIQISATNKRQHKWCDAADDHLF